MKTLSDRSWRGRARVTAAIVAFMATTTSAHAQGPKTPSDDDSTTAEARSLFAEGSRLYDLGDYDQAIQFFEKAYTLSGAPTLLLNIAQAYRLEGACAQAATLYRRFLEKVPNTPHRGELEARIDEMKSCAASPKRAAAPGSGPPPAARVGETAPRSEEQATPRTDDDATSSTTSTNTTGASTSTRWTILGWSGVGVAVVGSAVAATSLVMVLAREADLDRSCNADGGCPPSEQSRIDAHDTLRTVSIVSAVAAGIGVGAAIFGFVHARAATARTTARTFVAEPWISGSQIGVRGAF